MNNSILVKESTSAPLGSCLLVDYRLSSRSRLKEHISTTELFEEIHEPGSLAIGLEMVSKRRVETCIFGPSVKPERIQEFIEHSRMSGESSTCAFLVFQSRERREDVVGAHAVLEFPCSQPLFNVGMVKALAGANGGTLPPPRRTDPLTGKPISLKERLAKLEYPGQEKKVAEAEKVEVKPWPPELVHAVSVQLPVLYDNLLQVHPFNLKFRMDGSPSEFTLNAIANVIELSFAELHKVPEIERFLSALEPLLYRWVKRGTLQGRAAADFVLRRELRDCLRMEGPSATSAASPDIM
jgi:hypothetical protein